MARRLLGRVVPVRSARLAVERAEERPRRSAVAALEDAGGLDAREHASMRCRQTGDLGQLRTVVAVRETLARELPGLAEVVAAPHAGAVPLACRGCVDRAVIRVVDGVIDRASPRSTGPEPSSRAGLRRSPARSSPCAFRPGQWFAASVQPPCSTSLVESCQVRPPGARELIGAPMIPPSPLRPGAAHLDRSSHVLVSDTRTWPPRTRSLLPGEISRRRYVRPGQLLVSDTAEIGAADEFSAAAPSNRHGSGFEGAARPRTMVRGAGPFAHPQARLQRAGDPARAAPAGADRLLLPDARLGRSRPRTPSRRRSSARGGASTASRAARRCARGSTGSRRTSASTC